MGRWDDFRVQRLKAIKKYCHVRKCISRTILVIAHVKLKQMMNIYKQKWAGLKARNLRKTRF